MMMMMIKSFIKKLFENKNNKPLDKVEKTFDQVVYCNGMTLYSVSSPDCEQPYKYHVSVYNNTILEDGLVYCDGKKLCDLSYFYGNKDLAYKFIEDYYNKFIEDCFEDVKKAINYKFDFKNLEEIKNV
jgi:hypothetical protein